MILKPGMISTFFFALLTDRGYLAHWADENPIPLEILFEKPNIDWSYDPREMSRLYNKPKLGITYQKVDTLNQKYDDFGKVLYPDGPDQDFNNLWNGTVSKKQNCPSCRYNGCSFFPHRIVR